MKRPAECGTNRCGRRCRPLWILIRLVRQRIGPKRCGNRQQDLGLRGRADAKTIVLVQDNLNIHCKASLCEAFPPSKHAAWSSVSNDTTPPSTAVGLISPNPSRRPNLAMPRPPHSRQANVDRGNRCLERDRNAKYTEASWHFTTADARIALRHLYPSNLIKSGDQRDPTTKWWTGAAFIITIVVAISKDLQTPLGGKG
jgi:hypothetical protein